MRMTSRGMVVTLVVLARFMAQTAAHPRSVAITIDDGPAVNEMKDLGNFQRIARGLLSSRAASWSGFATRISIRE